jgi:hypothetical protein
MVFGPLLIGCPVAPAQDVSLLEQAERLADRGEVREAQTALARWQSDHAAAAPLEQRARAWLLAGRLADEGADAELHYLRVTIEGSTTQYADDALLRLGQYRYALDDPAGAIEYLWRLRRDYPTSEHGPTALLWIARAARRSGDGPRACEAADQGLAELAPGDTLLYAALREEQVKCRATERSYTVQVAALRDESAAQELARKLLEQGFDAWVLNATPRDPLYRVRVGRGLAGAEAEALARRLTEAGHSPFLVSQPEGPGGRP